MTFAFTYLQGKNFLVLILLCIELIIRKETKSVISEVLKQRLTIEAYLMIDPNVNFKIIKANFNIDGYTLLKYVCQKIDIKFRRLVQQNSVSLGYKRVFQKVPLTQVGGTQTKNINGGRQTVAIDRVMRDYQHFTPAGGQLTLPRDQSLILHVFLSETPYLTLLLEGRKY